MFVRDIETDKTDFAMVRAIHDIGRTMNMITVAEYVESEQARVLLDQIGVDLVQGFGIHKPCPLQDILAMDPSRLSKQIARPGGHSE